MIKQKGFKKVFYNLVGLLLVAVLLPLGLITVTAGWLSELLKSFQGLAAAVGECVGATATRLSE